MSELRASLDKSGLAIVAKAVVAIRTLFMLRRVKSNT